MMTAAPIAAPPIRILVVEDDPTVLDLMSATLETDGYLVDTARTSQAALGKARDHDYDIVILDLILPDADGVILHGKLKNLSPGLAGRTIFMTGFTSKEPVIDYLKSLSAEFLPKPFTAEELLRLVARIR